MNDEHPHRFSHRMRLRRRRDFQYVYRSGWRTHDRYLTLCIASNGLKNNRLGLSVGKRMGNAVRRNRCKRLLREAFRLLETPPDLPNYDLICIPNPKAKPSLGRYQQSMQNLLLRANQEDLPTLP